MSHGSDLLNNTNKMKIVKVKQDGKLKVMSTIAFNFGPKIVKQERQTISQIIKQRKNAERGARLVQMFSR